MASVAQVVAVIIDAKVAPTIILAKWDFIATLIVGNRGTKLKVRRGNAGIVSGEPHIINFFNTILLSVALLNMPFLWIPPSLAKALTFEGCRYSKSPMIAMRLNENIHYSA